MADKTLFGRLRRLFSTNVIVRNVGGRIIKNMTPKSYKDIIRKV